MEKFDLKKEYAQLWKASAKEPVILNVPKLNYLMVNGHGDPNTSEMFQQAIEALYGTAYTLKFTLKGEGKDFGVSALEGLWWMKNMADFSSDNKDEWLWTLMILMPPFVNETQTDKAKTTVKATKNNPLIDSLRFESFEEGQCAQILHLGPYSTEEPTIKKLHEFIKQNGKNLKGKHHEIYLGDPRRSAPEKLKTIIRQPFG